ncbi:Uroporphyrinogen decarboxylase [Kockovaella imperatae]|uniref:Uroporphyrinogen decarboxylase n=1 Tax=Kockovaella imperatae TaxID=4999 RepID=A0A1Y1UNG7_9TREE|nr:Uroporphyrinogen decarboxylase [Kockovaella imperatae]ORX39601.1 Uroporphyrinogen decarboxylase [Kockovaella imperatae]
MSFAVPKLKLAETWKELEFPELQNDLLLRAANGEETPEAPVWMMRQAGRALPEFRALREKHEFFKCCQTPELACEITLQPIERFKRISGSILFCDILVIPQALGMEVKMLPEKGPSFPEPLLDPSHLSRLNNKVNIDDTLGYVFDAITMIRKKLDGRVPLIGFCGAPWTLMAYMIEGGGSKTFEKAKQWLYRYPEESNKLLMMIADACADFLVGQVLAGAQMLQVFDTWAGELTPHHFESFELPALLHISRKVHFCLKAISHPDVKITLFAKGVHAPQSLRLISDPDVTGYATLSLDWQVDPVEVREIVGKKVNFQGNFDPVILYAGREGIEKEVERVCKLFHKAGGGWIANLGHGVTPNVKPDDMGWFLECIHKYSKR